MTGWTVVPSVSTTWDLISGYVIPRYVEEDYIEYGSEPVWVVVPPA
jgi:hypothetical protein